MKRIFLTVLDSFGVGEAPDAEKYKDMGSNTLKAVTDCPLLDISNMSMLGIYNIDGLEFLERASDNPIGNFGKMTELSAGKDTTSGHLEICGLIINEPSPTFPEGFDNYVLDGIRKITGRDILCNKPYSGTQLLIDYGDEHMQTGAIIVYTSADSVLQLAAHEEVIEVDTLYDYCMQIRAFMSGKYNVSRVIARPFRTNEKGQYYRTTNRHDYANSPPSDTMLDIIKNVGGTVISIGKISDIFNNQGITKQIYTKDNQEGIEELLKVIREEDFNGVCFTNLVDFDMLYGHRNDVEGYAKALNRFDLALVDIIEALQDEDILILTADHGCDPSTISTDHSREYVPVLIYGKTLKQGVNLGIRGTFADISATILDVLGIDNTLAGISMLSKIELK